MPSTNKGQSFVDCLVLHRCKRTFFDTSTKDTYRQHPNMNECGYKMANNADIGPHCRVYQNSHALFNEASRVPRGNKLDPLSPLALVAS